MVLAAVYFARYLTQLAVEKKETMKYFDQKKSELSLTNEVREESLST